MVWGESILDGMIESDGGRPVVYVRSVDVNTSREPTNLPGSRLPQLRSVVNL